MEELIHHYLPFAERKHRRHEPIDTIAISDDIATHNHSSPEIIVSAAHQLGRGQVPNEMSGIQFVQVGTDPENTAALQTLNNHLAMARSPKPESVL